MVYMKFMKQMKLKNISIHKPKEVKYLLSESDCIGVNQLLESGFSLVDALNLLTDKHNKDTITQLIRFLDEGNTIEECVVKFFPKSMSIDIVGFISFMSLEHAIKLAVELQEFSKGLQKIFTSTLIYPICIFIASIIGVQVFEKVCLSSLVSMMNSFNYSSENIILMFKLISLLINLIVVLIIVFMLILIYFINPKRQTIGYVMLSQITKKSIINEIISYKFVFYFSKCVKAGNKTKEAIEILKSLNKQPLIVFLCYHIDQTLLSGHSFTDAMSLKYLDESIAQFIKIAIYSSSLESMLSGYLQMSEKRLKQKIKSFSLVLQICAYLGIAVIIVVIYQILFLPLSMFEGM